MHFCVKQKLVKKSPCVLVHFCRCRRNVYVLETSLDTHLHMDNFLGQKKYAILLMELCVHIH